MTDSTASSTPDSPQKDLVLDLNFVPAWARKPASETPFIVRDASSGRGGAQRGRDSRNRRDQGRRAPTDRPRKQAHVPASRPSGRPAPRRGPDGPRERRGPAPAALPVRIRFLPDDRQLAAIMRRMRSSNRAFPLMEIVSLFLAKPDACRVKIESQDPSQKLHQCSVCNMVALGMPQLRTHMLATHMADVFDAEEVEAEAPAGNFVCVGECGLSHELLGPPNHNSMQERAEEIHRTRYPEMSFDSYRAHIRMLHDEDAIARWKEQVSHQRMYRRKDAPDAEAMRWAKAAAVFLEELESQNVRTAARVSLPVEVARKCDDDRLNAALRQAWERESRTPHSLPAALRGAFQHRDFHIFRAGRGLQFVTSVKPVPLDPEHAVDNIRQVLEHLRAHPGCTPRQLLEDLMPGTDPDSAEAAQTLSPLSWLIERGHIIEFFDGALAVPLSGTRAGKG